MVYTVNKLKQMQAEDKMLLQLYLVGAAILVGVFFLPAKAALSLQIAGLLSLLGYRNPPRWLLWAIWGAGSVALVIGILATAGIFAVPAWLAWALLGAGTISQ